jgi:hypothetical protein
MGCGQSKATVVESDLRSKQPWSVLKTQLREGDMVFLSGFDWVPALTGKERVFDVESQNWTYVGFVVIDEATKDIMLLEASAKLTKIRNLSGLFESNPIKLVNAEERIFRKDEKTGELMYKEGSIRHLSGYEATAKNKAAVKKSLKKIVNTKKQRDIQRSFNKTLAQGDYKDQVVDESEFFCKDVLLEVMEAYEFIVQGTYHPQHIEIDDFGRLQTMEGGIFYSSFVRLDMDSGTGYPWEELIHSYDPPTPCNIGLDQALNEDEERKIEANVFEGPALIAKSRALAKKAVFFDKEKAFPQATHFYRKALDPLDQYTMLDAYFRGSEDGPFLITFSQVELIEVKAVANVYRHRLSVIETLPKGNIPECNVVVPESTGAKLWQRARKIGRGTEIQNRTDDLIEQVGDRLNKLKKTMSWRKLLGRPEEQTGEPTGDEENSRRRSSEPAGRISAISTSQNPLFKRMRSAGMLKQRLSNVAADAFQENRENDNDTTSLAELERKDEEPGEEETSDAAVDVTSTDITKKHATGDPKSSTTSENDTTAVSETTHSDATTTVSESTHSGATTSIAKDLGNENASPATFALEKDESSVVAPKPSITAPKPSAVNPATPTGAKIAGKKSAVAKPSSSSGDQDLSKSAGSKRPSASAGSKRPSASAGSKRPSVSAGSKRPSASAGSKRPSVSAGSKRPSMSAGSKIGAGGKKKS